MNNKNIFVLSTNNMTEKDQNIENDKKHSQNIVSNETIEPFLIFKALYEVRAKSRIEERHRQSNYFLQVAGNQVYINTYTGFCRDQVGNII